jgi:DEAD/DEAH box helicase/NLI interacting factor-like phosphatase
MEGGAAVVVATPEELINSVENGGLSLKQVAYLVLYEADLLLTTTVEPLIHKILPQLPSKHCQTFVSTTTWPKEVRNISSLLLDDPVMVSADDTTDGTVTDSCTKDLSGESNAIVPRELGPLAPAKKKLLVLDINGILADIVMLNSGHSQKAHFKIKGKSGKYFLYTFFCKIWKKIANLFMENNGMLISSFAPVFKRPFCDDFLEFCFKNFEVGIWSSRYMYVL